MVLTVGDFVNKSIQFFEKHNMKKTLTEIKWIVESTRPSYMKENHSFSSAAGIDRQAEKEKFGIQPCTIHYLAATKPFIGEPTGVIEIRPAYFNANGNPIDKEEYLATMPPKWSRS